MSAVLVRPGAPSGRKVVLVIEGLVVGAVFLVKGEAVGEDGSDVIIENVGNEIQHGHAEGGGLVGVTSGGDELRDLCGCVGG